jgi:hypothetical protein
LDQIGRAFATGGYRVALHAREEMVFDQITTNDLEDAFGQGRPEMVEHYPADPRGESCLILGWAASGPVHVVLGISMAPFVVVTVYRPDPERWMPDMKTRRRGS